MYVYRTADNGCNLKRVTIVIIVRAARIIGIAVLYSVYVAGRKVLCLTSPSFEITRARVVKSITKTTVYNDNLRVRILWVFGICCDPPNFIEFRASIVLYSI